ncbi:Fic family protein [Oligoflexus sp.]|uniref:Fic family protein n=1 Tax=Oligoflexus sp. TaxID=1971216 RepID=UPI002D7A356B|nr:Fic family protein [Oligoflexus sp.]
MIKVVVEMERLKVSSAVKATPLELGFVERRNPNYRDSNFQLDSRQWATSGFSLGRFLARYWCGDKALREDRSISRKRLALVSAGIDNGDREARRLRHQIDLYLQAFRHVVNSAEISVNLVCQINKLVNQNHPQSGELRNKQNSIGDPRNPRYIPPRPEAVPALMCDLAEFANDVSVHAMAKAITVHSQLLAIHPFCDGNGRTARVLMDGMIDKVNPDYVSLSLYRLRNEKSYLDALDQFGITGNMGLRHRYWKEAFELSESFKAEVDAIIAHAECRLYSGLAAFDASDDLRLICKDLWQQPIIPNSCLSLPAGWSDARFSAAIEKLVLAGVLELRDLKKPIGTQILSAPIIFQAWQQIDELVFAHEQSFQAGPLL